MVSLFDNATGSWTTGTNVNGTWEIGSRFNLTIDAQVSGLRWYRFATGAGNAPAAIHLWDLTTHTQLANPTVPDNGAVGWQTVTLATPVQCDATHLFAVSIIAPNGMTFGYRPQANLGTPTVPLLWNANCRCWVAPTGTGEPTSNDNVLAWGIDVTVGDAPIPPPPDTPVTSGNLADSLAAWLSESDATHRAGDGIPWDTWQLAQTLHTIITNIPQTDDPLWTAAGKLWQIAGALTDAEIAAWNLFAQRAPSQLTGASGGGGSAFYTTDGQLVSALVEQIWEATTPARSLPPGTGWTLAGETTWDSTLAWDVGANCYLVTVDSYPPAQPATDGPAGTWLYRLGWWSVLNGSYASGREWLEFGQQFLYRNGLFMPGLALQARGGTTGSVQAWVTG